MRVSPDLSLTYGWQRIRTIDLHTAGEPLRIVVEGFPEIPGDSILAKRRYAREHLDQLRRALMLEPRGHADMYGCIPVDPVTPDGDIGVLFIHNEGFSTMCGHGIIAIVKAGIDTGFLAAKSDDPVVRIDTPAGRVTATAHAVDGITRRVSFLNVPSFVLERDLTVDVEGIGAVTCDIAFGGAFYAYVDAEAIGLTIDAMHQRDAIDIGMRIKRAVMDQYAIEHPSGDDDLNFLYGTILVQRLEGAAHSRNVCIFADGEVDRSPTGTGVSGRAAIHYARGEIGIGESITIESIIGTSFEVAVHATTTVGGRDAIIPEVSGSAHVTGRHEFLIDPDDPLREGVLLR